MRTETETEPMTMEVMVEFYKAGLSFKDIKGIDPSATPYKVNLALEHFNVPAHPVGRPRIYAEWEQVKDRYTAGATLTELAQEYPVSEATISNRLQEMGVKIRPAGNRPSGPTKRTMKNVKVIKDLLELGMTPSCISRQLKLTRQRICQIMEEHGIPNPQ